MNQDDWEDIDWDDWTDAVEEGKTKQNPPTLRQWLGHLEDVAEGSAWLTAWDDIFAHPTDKPKCDCGGEAARTTHVDWCSLEKKR